MFVSSGLVMVIVLHFVESITPFHILPKILLLLTMFCAAPKTFFFLRVFEGLSYITAMLVNVVADLQAFMFFYVILLFMFA